MSFLRAFVFVIALLLGGLGAVSHTYACSMQDHSFAPSDMNPMTDCPLVDSDGQLDLAQCAVACYGLAVSLNFDLLPSIHVFDSPTARPTVILSLIHDGYTLGVPTPPPNLV